MDFLTLHVLLASAKTYSHETIRQSGLSDTECMICSYVFRHEACVQDDVVQGLRMDKTTAAKALQSLVEKGFVTRTTDPDDRRKKRLELTSDGKAQCAELTKLHDKWLTRVLSVLSPDEQAQFAAYCTRLLEQAEAISSEQHPD